ncbi:MAG: GNAT family N-acetyltransferase [Pseudorhodoplanes sp.]
MNARLSHIEPIRAASRRLVRELGFLRGTLAGTSLPPSAVHALVEMGARGAPTARELADILRLEKSSVSRLVRKLIEAGLVGEKPGESDGRTKALSLTPKGRKLLAGIHDFARKQVAAALKRLPDDQYTTVVRGLSLYADALAGRKAVVSNATDSVRIETGYAVNAFARCIEMQTAFYARMHGFGRTFEAAVAGGLAEFSTRMDRSCNRFWRAMQDDRIVGTIAIDGEDLGPGAAHLRWFIVEDGMRGCGVGRRLLSAAVAFCDQRKFPETHLWTFRGLDAARRLYEAHGFERVEEHSGTQWGRRVMEQRFVRKRQT